MYTPQLLSPAHVSHFPNAIPTYFILLLPSARQITVHEPPPSPNISCRRASLPCAASFDALPSLTDLTWPPFISTASLHQHGHCLRSLPKHHPHMPCHHPHHSLPQLPLPILNPCWCELSLLKGARRRQRIKRAPWWMLCKCRRGPRERKLVCSRRHWRPK